MLVTIVSGFLGSGKTTLMRRLLRNTRGQRLAVIVNDMSDLEVDGDLLRDPEWLNEARGNFVSIQAGSISGSQRAAFAAVLEAWEHRTDVDHLIIETSGSTHPWPLVEEIGQRQGYVLNTFVTLLDAKALVSDFDGGRALQDLSHPQAPLMRAQIQLATQVLLTKCEAMPEATLQTLVGHVKTLNPHTQVFAVSFGHISAAKLLGTGSFDLRRARQTAESWPAEMHEAAEAAPLGSTIINDPRPLHPRRLWTLFHERLGTGILRSKGFLWLASRSRDVLLWDQAGGSLGLELTAYWKAALVTNPDGRLTPEEVTMLQEHLRGCHPLFGDRGCELTIIGPEQDRSVFVPGLLSCFCTDDEIAHWQAGGMFEDPWPKSLRVI